MRFLPTLDVPRCQVIRRWFADYTVMLVDPDRPRRRLGDRHFWTRRGAVEWAALNAELFSVAIVRARIQGGGTCIAFLPAVKP